MIAYLTILGVFAILLYRVIWARRAKWTWPGWRRPAMWIRALAIIFASEAFLSSLPLTGLERPKSAVPDRYLGQMAAPRPEAPESYGDMAQCAPWMWSIGAITRPEMERRVQADLPC
jgi:hypothetical protein